MSLQATKGNLQLLPLKDNRVQLNDQNTEMNAAEMNAVA